MDLQDLITGRIQQVEISESFVNQLLHEHGLNHTVQFRNNSIVLSANNFKAEFSYHSHDFINGSLTVNFCLHAISPFYYGYGLQLINRKYPWLEYQKDSDGNKVITCHLDKIHGIDGILKDYRSYTNHVHIESVNCREGKITVEFRKKSGVKEGDEQHV